MEWRIRETSRGDFMAEYGGYTDGSVLAPSGIGYIMPAFIVYKAARFDTKKEAKRYIDREQKARR